MGTVRTHNPEDDDPDPSEPLDDQYELAARMKASGVPVAEIARRLGVNLTTAQRWFNEKMSSPNGVTQKTPRIVRKRANALAADAAIKVGLSPAIILLRQQQIVEHAIEAKQFKAAADANAWLFEKLKDNPELVIEAKGTEVVERPTADLLSALGAIEEQDEPTTEDEPE